MLDTYTPAKVLSDPAMGVRMTSRPVFMLKECDLRRGVQLQDFLATPQLKKEDEKNTFKSLSIKEMAKLVDESGDHFMQGEFFMVDWVRGIKVDL